MSYTQESLFKLFDSLILGECNTSLRIKDYKNLAIHENKYLIHALESAIIIKREDLADMIREELGKRIDKK